MPNKKYTVDLSEDERAELEGFVSHGKRSAQAITRARILLRADEGVSDADIADALDCSKMTAHRIRKRYCEDGIAAIHRRDPDREYERKLDGEDEAHLIALACSDPPDGRHRWTLRLLADELVALEETDVESVSHETVRQTLKKTNCSLTDPNNG
jgi:transposase